MGKVRNRIYNLYNRKYDYYFLKSKLTLMEKTVETIIAGSSYACFAVDEKKNQICLGLPSQDFYYSRILIEEALSKLDGMKRVVLICGYYDMFFDLSKSKALEGCCRIMDVYVPLLGDSHHSVNKLRIPCGFRNKVSWILDVFLSLSMRFLVFKKPIECYFDDKYHTRFKRRRIYWNNSECKWEDLTDQERKESCKKRVWEHEKLLKYQETFVENKSCLEELYQELQGQEIKLYIFIAPFPTEYLENMSDEYKYRTRMAEKILKRNCDFYVDFNCTDLDGLVKEKFDKTDFVDTDHLNDSGAKKFTRILNKILTSVLTY